MSEPTAAADAVQIPVEPRISGAPRPPVSVNLPVVCRPKRFILTAYALFFAVLAVAFAFATFAVLLYSREPRAPLKFLLPAATGFLAFCTGALGLTFLADTVRRGPSLIIDSAGFEDRRQKIRLAWSEVLQAEIRPSRIGIAHIALTTRSGRVIRGAPFRAGAYRRRGDQIVIPLQFLTPPPYISALVMTAFIERTGGVVLGKPFWAQT